MTIKEHFKMGVRLGRLEIRLGWVKTYYSDSVEFLYHASGVKWTLRVTENRKPFYRPAMYPWCWGTTPCCLKVILAARFFFIRHIPPPGHSRGTRD